MKIELLQTLSKVSYILAALMFVLLIALFFLLDIKKVFGDLSGTTAKKSIENIRMRNESTGKKTYKSSSVNIERGKTTEDIVRTGELSANANLPGDGGAMPTEKIKRHSSGKSKKAEKAGGFDETVVLTANNAPAGGFSQDTTVLSPDFSAVSQETTVLSGGFAAASQETTVLNAPNVFANQNISSNTAFNGFSIDVEIGFCESSEVI